MLKRVSSVAVFTLALAGVSAGADRTRDPTITITSVPPYGANGHLGGVVAGAAPADYHVATYLFLEGGGWWTKPTFSEPCTAVNPDGTFLVNVTTGGCDIYANMYAVYLLPIAEDCPLAAGDSVPPPTLATTAVASDLAERYPVTVDAFGHSWRVKDSPCLAGPGPNYFSPANVWVDTSGDVHLAVAWDATAGRWECAELFLAESFGYGEYRVHTTGRVDTLDPRMVLGMFTWDGWAPPHFREMDVELSRWSVPADPDNAQFVVQPWNLAGNRHRFPIALTAADDDLTFLVEWLPGEVAFSAYHGHHLGPPPASDLVERWRFAVTGVPTPGSETYHLNLWLDQGLPPLGGLGEEVVVTHFAFRETVVFMDGLESGTTAGWSATTP